MTEVRLKKELTEVLKELSPQIEEALKYGVPHVVGEIRNNSGQLEVNATVSIFESSHHFLRLTSNGELLFIYPAEDSHPYRLFLDIWRFLEGKKSGSAVLGPGSMIKGNLRENLRRHGYEILWMNVQPTSEGEMIGVWARKGEVRYNFTFKKAGKDKFLLVEFSRV
ncbi:hypothetical protein [Thermococcus sp.]|uniref:hypothetical protein n=1 Tax=Thermococcus sp. TaxID=35749 RepID=UPI002622A469|nr:hypothetical protein [Thermococcus sp.]